MSRRAKFQVRPREILETREKTTNVPRINSNVITIAEDDQTEGQRTSEAARKITVRQLVSTCAPEIPQKIHSTITDRGKCTDEERERARPLFTATSKRDNARK